MQIGSRRRRHFFNFFKKFDFESSTGSILYSVSSPIWRIWTFPIKKDGTEVAKIEKKWSGALTELFTDADNFKATFESSLKEDDKKLIISAAIFIDLQYFEKKANTE